MSPVEQNGLYFFETEQYEIGELLLRPHGYSQNYPLPFIYFLCILLHNFLCFSKELELEDTGAHHL